MPYRTGAAQEPPRLVDRLRLALAIGREQRAAWPSIVAALKANSAPRASSCQGTTPVLAVGVITAPSHGARRTRIREARDVMLARGADSHRCAATITFLLGAVSMMTPAERAAVLGEQKKHGDMLLLPAHDGAAASAVGHGGRAVAEKALGWFVHAAKTSPAQFVAKVDDDTLVNLPRIVGELRDVLARAPRPEHTYYGIHVYRLWDWGKQPAVGNAACGRHEESGPPHDCHRLLASLKEAVGVGGKCAGSLGPYPFPDGSLEVLGRGLLADVFTARKVTAFAAHSYRQARPPIWTHEDAGLGALVHREVVNRDIPLTYVALRRWEHNRFWLNWADTTTLVDGDVQWAHYTCARARVRRTHDEPADDAAAWPRERSALDLGALHLPSGRALALALSPAPTTATSIDDP